MRADMEKIWVKRYQKGIPSEINMNEYSSLVHIMEEAFHKFASRPAFHNMGKTLTYAEIDQQSNAFASYLQNSLKLHKGDRVAIMMPNILQYPVCLLGILKSGMTVVNVNPLYTARELEYQLKDSGAKAIVIVANFASVLQEALPKTDVKHVIVTELGDLLGFPKSLLVNFIVRKVRKMVPEWDIPGAISLNRALIFGRLQKPKPIKCTHQDIAFLQYTGGTTGVSKGAILTHGNIIANMLQARVWMRGAVEEGKEIIITPLPLYHIFSLTANCFVFSSVGALNVLITNPRDMAGFIKELKKWKFTAFTGVNTLFNGLLNQEEFGKLDFSALKVTLGGGMAVQEAVAKRWKELTGKPLIEAYGLTETSPAACINPMDLPEYNGFIGIPIPSTDVVIKDEAEANLPFGEIGEISIKGPQVMQGYWNRPDETEKVMSKDGYFKTGDLGFMTEDGFIKLVDRKKDMILVSGFNVYPNEIEDIVAKIPKVLECAAIAVPDAKSGEAIKLFVVKKDPSLTTEEIILFCRQNMTGYKIPKIIEFRSDLPKSNVGKILRRELRDMDRQAQKPAHVASVQPVI